MLDSPALRKPVADPFQADTRLCPSLLYRPRPTVRTQRVALALQADELSLGHSLETLGPPLSPLIDAHAEA